MRLARGASSFSHSSCLAQTSSSWFGGGTGSEVMQRIAVPRVGGMVIAPLLSMLVVPATHA